MEKVDDVEAKANLQPPFYISKIDARYPKGHRSLAKKDKDDANRKHQDETPKNKAKSNNSFFANQLQTQASKKDKRGGCQGGYPATGVNATEVAKKDKNKAKDLSHVKCYTCKQKCHYINIYSKKSKN